MIIANEVQLRKEMNGVIERALERVTDRMIEKLRKRIDEDVYTNDGKNKWYVDGFGHPTYQFKWAWEWTTIKKSMKQITTELFYNDRKVSYIGESWVHGNPYQSAVETLPDILNMAFRNYQHGTTSEKKPWKYGKPYWDNFIKETIDSGWFDKTFKEEMKREGIVVK